jgi:hypothetical protein
MAAKLRQQELFLAALMVEPTIAMAAQAARISEATATRWMKDDAFRRRYADARHQALGETLALLQKAMLGAVATLQSVMLASATKPATKVQAARAILELGLRACVQEGLEAKMDELLKQMEELKGARV